jgi:Tfp pilus assembly protein PilF
MLRAKAGCLFAVVLIVVNSFASLRAADQVIRFDPMEADGYIEKAKQIFLSGQHLPEALLAVEEAIRVDPKSAEAITTRAHIREAMGDASGAFSDYRAAIELDPGLTESSEGLARTSAKLSDPQTPQVSH